MDGSECKTLDLVRGADASAGFVSPFRNGARDFTIRRQRYRDV